jgi:hypothetical protein
MNEGRATAMAAPPGQEAATGDRTGRRSDEAVRA